MQLMQVYVQKSISTTRPRSAPSDSALPAGVLNHVLAAAHVPPQKWLGDPSLAMLCVVIPGIWAGVGAGSLIYQAALTSIPDELYESASVEGAGPWAKVRHITFPQLKPLLLIKWPDRCATQIGDIVTFFLKYTNQGGQPITDVVVSDSLTARLEYVPGSARSDRDSVFTTQPNEAGSLILRWEINGALPPGQNGVVSFQARIR